MMYPIREAILAPLDWDDISKPRSWASTSRSTRFLVACWEILQNFRDSTDLRCRSSANGISDSPHEGAMAVNPRSPSTQFPRKDDLSWSHASSLALSLALSLTP